MTKGARVPHGASDGAAPRSLYHVMSCDDTATSEIADRKSQIGTQIQYQFSDRFGTSFLPDSPIIRHLFTIIHNF